MIHTKRLVIRKVILEDAESVWGIWNHIDNQKYMHDPVVPIEEVKSICDTANTVHVLISKESEEIIGTCSFGPTNEEKQWWLGYSLKKEHWGMGYMTEAVEGIVDYAKANGITNIIADCAKENIGSNKVLEKSGFTLYKTSSFKQHNTNIEFKSNDYKIEI